MSRQVNGVDAVKSYSIEMMEPVEPPPAPKASRSSWAIGCMFLGMLASSLFTNVLLVLHILGVI